MAAPEMPAPQPATQPAETSPVALARWPWLRFATPILVLLLAAALVITLTWNWNSWQGGRAEQVTDDAFVQGDLTPLSTKVAGIVRGVKVTDYQRVHKGDLLFELQDDDYQADIAQAAAAVAAAKAAIENNARQQLLQDARIDRAIAGTDQAKAQIVAAQAGINAAQAEAVRTQQERDRQEALLATQSTTKQQVETAVANQESYAAQEASRSADLQEAKTGLRSSEIAVEAERRSKAVLQSQDQQLLADLQAKEAALAVAKINLGYTRIYAPDDGIVGERQVRPGQLVSPGTQVVTFVAQTKWVIANYLETQLTHMKVGDPAEIRVDAYPGHTLRGRVQEIAPASGSQFALLPPDNATGNYTKVVQRVPVKIAFDDADQSTRLRPGLSVVVSVRTRN